MRFQPAGDNKAAAPTEREPNSVTLAINISPRWGKTDGINLLHFKLESANAK